jgi:hypothetical protein
LLAVSSAEEEAEDIHYLSARLSPPLAVVFQLLLSLNFIISILFFNDKKCERRRKEEKRNYHCSAVEP